MALKFHRLASDDMLLVAGIAAFASAVYIVGYVAGVIDAMETKRRLASYRTGDDKGTKREMGEDRERGSENDWK